MANPIYRGPKGDTGAQGPKGEKGDRGEPGPQGKDGTMTFADLTDEQKASLKGDKGDKGDAFTYSDFTTEQLAALKGPKGDKGDKGDIGETGAAFTYDMFTPDQLASLKGETGAKGEKGDTGAKGEKGDTGAAFTYDMFTSAQLASLKGEKGDKGETGEPGAPGAKGEKGDKGDVGAAFTYDMFTEEQLAALKGAKGDKGDTGAQGEQGVQGEKGEQGIKGDTGAQGPKGDSGVYVGTTPGATDTVWINPDDTNLDEFITETELTAKDYATKAYVNNAVAAGGGGSTGGNEAHYIILSDFSLPDDSFPFIKECYDYYVANNKPKPVDIYIREHYSSNFYLVTKQIVELTNRSIELLYNAGNSFKGLKVFYQEDGSVSSSNANIEYSMGSKDWIWTDAIGNTFVNVYDLGSSTHIKIVGYWDSDTNNVATYEISTSNNNWFQNETGSKYYVSEPYNDNRQTTRFYFYNDGNTLSYKDENGNDYFSNGFTLLGYYYWG